MVRSMVHCSVEIVEKIRVMAGSHGNKHGNKHDNKHGNKHGAL